MNKSLLKLIMLILSLSSNVFGLYPNEVKDSVPFDQVKKIYKFEFTITHGMAMAVQNKQKGTFDPVLYNIPEMSFYKRDSDLDTVCDKIDKVTNSSEIDTIVAATGVHRPLFLINGMFPGPQIVVEKDSHVEITLHNKLLSDIVNIHWHGQVQKGSFFMDGVPHVTECPIGPGESYTYKFIASNAGTHWYHAHSGLQRSDGIYGPLIVKEKSSSRNDLAESKLLGEFKNYSSKIEEKETKLYDKEYLLILQDWEAHGAEFVYTTVLWRNFKFFPGYGNTNSCVWHNRFMDGTFLPPVPFDTIIINGKGWHELPTNFEELSKLDSVLNLPIEKFDVEPNKKYLFRIINAAGGHPFQVRVSGHKLRLVATDGNKIKPIDNVDSIIIHSGERYDFELDTKSAESAENSFIFVNTLETFTYGFNKFDKQHYGLALLKYSNVKDNQMPIAHDGSYFRTCSKEQPCRTANCFHAFNKDDHECISLDKFESLNIDESDKILLKNNYQPTEFKQSFLNFHFSGHDNQRASTNNFRYVNPSTPPHFLQNSQDSFTKCSSDCVGDALCSCTHLLKLETNKVVQLIVFSMGKGSTLGNTPHPIHLHGHHFYVVKMGFPGYDEKGFLKTNNRDINCAENVNYCNQVNWTNSQWNNGNIENMSNSPVKKDTVFIPNGGYLVLRFLTDNIGYWFLHCHIENHMAEGMTVLVQEGTDEEIRNSVNWNEINTCGKGFTRTGKSSGNSLNKLNIQFIIIFLANIILTILNQ